MNTVLITFIAAIAIIAWGWLIFKWFWRLFTSIGHEVGAWITSILGLIIVFIGVSINTVGLGETWKIIQGIWYSW